MSKIIGIDLGTTGSVVAVVEGGEPRVLENSEGGRITPSIVAFKADGERLAGGPAKRQAVTNPQNTIFSIKRFMGRKYDEVREEQKTVPYQVLRDKAGLARVQINDQLYAPQEISAMILQKLKVAAEEYLGEEVTEAVITVPAYFNDAQRKATKEAGEIAGLKVRRIINEPTAAALAFGLDKQNKDRTVAVYDLGGGTYDISILELGGGIFEVKSTNGDTHLGGDDFDQVLIDHVAENFLQEKAVDIRRDPMALQRLKEACEKAKIELSSSNQTTINLPFITMTPEGPQHLTMNISRSRFESLIEHLVNRTIGPMKQALKDAKLNVSKIDEVLLVGGSTRVPLVEKTVEEFFGKAPNKSVNPDEVVALGAAVQGAVLSQDITDVLLLDVTPLNLGIETLGGRMTVLIEANTTIPSRKQEVFSTAEDNQPAVQIHVLQGNRPMATGNRTIGQFRLEGIRPAPRGVPQIEVAFDIDANGILNVSAKDQQTGKEQSIRIEAGSGLSDQEIERMRQDAKDHEEEDRKMREEVDKLNQAESVVYAAEKLLREDGDKLSPNTKEGVENAASALKSEITERNIDAIDSAVESLTQAMQAAAMEIQQSAQSSADPDPNGEQPRDVKYEEEDG